MPLDATLDSLMALWPALTPEQRVLVRDMAGNIHAQNLYHVDVLIVAKRHLDGLEAVAAAARTCVGVWREGSMPKLNLTIREHDAWLDRLDAAERALTDAITPLDAARPDAPEEPS